MDKSIAQTETDWTTFLVKHGVSVADAQTAAKYHISYQISNSQVNGNSTVFRNDSYALWEAFLWADTPEGHAYWSAVNRTFLLNHEPRS